MAFHRFESSRWRMQSISSAMCSSDLVGVAKAAKQYGCEVIAFAGSVTEEAIKCNEKGIDAFFSILPGVCSLDEAMNTETAQKNMRNAAEQVFRLILDLYEHKT